MGERGPAPKPTALRILHGEDNYRINKDEPIPATVEVQCPEWMPAEGVEVWNRIGPDLVAKGVLTFWDVELFARFCWFSARCVDLILQVEREGQIITGDKGMKVKHPAMQLIRDATTQMLSISRRFGLTPSDRQSLSIHHKEDKGGTGELLSG